MTVKGPTQQLAKYIGVLAKVQSKLIGMLRANGAISHNQTSILIDTLETGLEDVSEALKDSSDLSRENQAAE